MEEEEVTWSTWEELLLGAAVLRHGSGDWVTIAAELRSRALSPFSFTPEACRAKYDDLQQHYSGCTTWFEEVRKKRMAELRQALEVSEDSIGSLETKLETLKAEKGESHVNYASSQTESPVASQKSEGFESFSKESKDGLSAGSFTLEMTTSWSADCQIPLAASTEEAETKPGDLSFFDQRKVLIIEKLAENAVGKQGGTLKKRRGIRKRKDCSVGESSFVDSANATTTFRSKENTTSDCAEVSRSSVLDNQTRERKEDEIDDLLKVFNSIVEHKCASSFRHRLDSQKRGRYKRMIRKHVDFDTLRSRITSHAIVSVKELFRDLLLLANNALVFYSKSTREYKSAWLLRDLTTKSLHHHFNGCNSSGKTSSSISPTMITICASPAKPPSVLVQPSNKNLSTKTTNLLISDVAKAPKKGVTQPKRVGRKSNVQQKCASPLKGRKRARTR